MKILSTLIVVSMVFNHVYARPPELPESMLEPTEKVDPCKIDYSNSLFTERYKAGYLADPKHSLYHCGQTVWIKSNIDQLAIVLDYRWANGEWVYQLQKAHWAEDAKP